MAVHLNQHHLVPLARTAALMQDRYGVSLSQASIQSFAQEAAQSLRPTVAAIGQAVQKADIVHADESGIRVNGKLHWLHCTVTNILTWLAIPVGLYIIILPVAIAQMWRKSMLAKGQTVFDAAMEKIGPWAITAQWMKSTTLPAPSALIGASNFFELAFAADISLFGFNSGAVLATAKRSKGWYEQI